MNKTRLKSNAEGQGLFLSLSWISYALLSAILFLTYFLIQPRILQASQWLNMTVLTLLGLTILVLGGGLVLITLSVTLSKDLLYPHNGFQITMRVLPPIVFSLGKLFGITKDRLLESFIAIQNQIFIVQRKRVNISKILLLLPHCLQNHDCKWKITWSVENCKRCGLCPIGGLSDLSDKYGISLYVATGGTVARRVVKEVRPTIILAVACPRDLASGMVDVYPIPVFGILNERPNGPCFDTTINLDIVDEVLSSISSDK